VTQKTGTLVAAIQNVPSILQVTVAWACNDEFKSYVQSNLLKWIALKPDYHYPLVHV